MRVLFAAVATLWALAAGPAAADQRYVYLVTIDGLRWQELFRGADPDLVEAPAWRARFVDVPDRAAALTPFLNSFAQSGALIGNRDAGSCARVSNRYWFSYPGYAEMLLGRPHPTIGANAKARNRDATILEWLNGKPPFAGQVRVFAEWDTVPYILDVERTGLSVFAPEESSADHDGQVIAAFNKSFSQGAPPVAWIALGDTDNAAHAGDYYGYLAAAAQADAFLASLWDRIEAHPQLQGRTTLVVTTDHGRGESAGGRWQGHGSGRYRSIWVPGLRHEGSDAVWFAVRGPAIAAGAGGAYRGDRCALTAQTAATLAVAAGADPAAFSADAAPALELKG